MPGTPMDPENSKLNKLRKDNVQQENADENEQNLQNVPDVTDVVHERTQTDVLNKRLLMSFLDRINKKSEELSDLEEKQTENKEKDQVDSDF